MLYDLTNGNTIYLKNNVEVAKFVFFVSPRDGVFLMNKPTIIMDAEVEKLMSIREKISNNIAKSKSKILEGYLDEGFGDFDDDIPF